jgi:hypothetical protein
VQRHGACRHHHVRHPRRLHRPPPQPDLASP